ncbi:hypothetical protein GCM10025867_42040 [Frondihabitans sucicola]|uniref:Amine oxidase domain-containing protein n=1 Tax=Frondihabitans sucicola TaxID=1268041 RepID=A0ABN6Y7L6_9MICO|nr:FAD-dependent oxidoreductase [Frondihabitans sucicola]BDZ51963.1 hypothetical protein GCM10025867_42040 [Frondihabitans sucicola]
MSISRRLFLTGSLSGAGVLLLSACTDPAPKPSATATRSPSPTPTPTPTATGPKPSAFRRSTWGTDPYAYGSSSFLTADSTDDDRSTLRTPLDDKVFFAGEAVAETDPGTVMGAHASGLAAAAQVAAVAGSGERIAVIGAGMAGATAARALADQGFDVVVVEARHRVGGRIASYESDDWPIEVQLGVSTLFGDGASAFESLLAAEGVSTVELAASGTASLDGRTSPLPTTAAITTALASAYAWAERQSQEVTVSSALTGSGAAARLGTTADATGVSDADRLAFLLTDALPARFGAGPSALSARVLDEEPLPQGAHLVTEGFGDYVTAQLKDLDVLRGSNVTQIDYGNQGIGLRFVTGESLSADRVVSTIPLGVLKKKKIVFVPALPAAQLASIDALGVGVQDVLWLRFDEKLWSSDATVWAVLDDSATYKIWLNLEPATGSPILVALTGGSAATKIGKLGDGEAVAAAVASISSYFDLAPSTASPTPTPSSSPAP